MRCKVAKTRSLVYARVVSRSQHHAWRRPPWEQGRSEAIREEGNLLAQSPPSWCARPWVLLLLLLLSLRIRVDVTATAVRGRASSASPVGVGHSRSIHSCRCRRRLVLEAAQERRQHPDLGQEDGCEGGCQEAAAQAGALRVEDQASEEELDQQPDVGKLHTHARSPRRLAQGGGASSDAPGVGARLAFCTGTLDPSSYGHHPRAAETRRQLRARCGQEDQERRRLLRRLRRRQR